MLFGSLLSTGLGGILDAVGGSLGTSLFDTGGSSTEAGMQSLRDMQQIAPGLTEAAMFNAAGQTGAETGLGFRKALDALAPSSVATSTANSLRAMGSQAMSGLSEQFANAARQSQMASGNIRRDMMNRLGASGASPAAMTAAAVALGRANTAGKAALLGQTGGQLQSALGLSANLMNQAQQTLNSDLALRNQIYVDPYKAQVNGGIMGLGNTMAQMGSSNQREAIVNNPLAGLGTAMGAYGGGLMTQLFDQRSTPFTNADQMGRYN